MVTLLVSIRESSTTDETQLNAISQHMSINRFFDVLKHAEDLETATTLSDWFKEIWKAHMDHEVRFKLDTGGANSLLENKMEQALSLFSEVVDMDPTYAHAYSKASTTEYMLGNLDASLTAGLKAVELIPRYFHALNGLGLVYNEKKDLELAADSFRKSIELDPWSPVSGRLSVCLTTLERWRKSAFRTKETVKSADDDPSKSQN
jgi:tetratricopeptide (TPR) repeat protein